ncbi:sce7726 family protein [Vibrio crassostreae]|uniref:sce7726 family protein n=1 Tax=Vibrio crassostreae TaxID=246167 RepID=UPI001B307454|nr:sce7726 family protein [Vibrio crassostreae]
MNDEKQIACKLIDYLENKYKFDFLAREVPFSGGERRADLVAGSRCDNSTYGFEIKSDNDTLSRLAGQLESYRCTFNYVFVVTTKKYLPMVKKYGLWFGVLLIDSEGKITIERDARKRNLISNTSDRPQLKTSDGDCNVKYLEWLCQRYVPLYEIFVKERTAHLTTEEDIKILSLRSDRITIF